MDINPSTHRTLPNPVLSVAQQQQKQQQNAKTTSEKSDISSAQSAEKRYEAALSDPAVMVLLIDDAVQHLNRKKASSSENNNGGSDDEVGYFATAALHSPSFVSDIDLSQKFLTEAMDRVIELFEKQRKQVDKSSNLVEWLEAERTKAQKEAEEIYNNKQSRPRDAEDKLRYKSALASKCDYCGVREEITKSLKSCARCNAAKYCDKICQANGWPRHKAVCKELCQQQKRHHSNQPSQGR